MVSRGHPPSGVCSAPTITVLDHPGGLVSQSSYDAPTGPIRGRASAAPGQPANPNGPAGEPTRRRNLPRDLIAAGLLVIAPFLPWNLYFGVGIPDSKTVLFAVLGAVTLLSLIAIAAPAGRLRLMLNIPYWLLVLGFIGYDVFETIRSGGGVHVPGGVGPGAWLGMAGSVLSAQPLITGPAAADERPDGWSRAARIIGYASMIGATLSSAFNLFWRVRFALHDTTGAGFGKQNIVVIVTATVYGLVAWVAVLIASRWLVKSTKADWKASRLALVALGASTLVAGPLVWFLPVGRDIDSFHGIAQNTSTAGVGYEGYLAWAVGAAIFAPRVLPGYRRGGPDDAGAWRTAARMASTADHRVVRGLGADADHRLHRRGDFELPVLPLRHHDAGRIRSGHRGLGDLASDQTGQHFGADQTDHVAVPGFSSRSASRASCWASCWRRGSWCHRRRRVEQPGLRKQSRASDHQHLRRGTVRAGAGHPHRRQNQRSAQRSPAATSAGAASTRRQGLQPQGRLPRRRLRRRPVSRPTAPARADPRLPAGYRSWPAPAPHASSGVTTPPPSRYPSRGPRPRSTARRRAEARSAQRREREFAQTVARVYGRAETQHLDRPAGIGDDVAHVAAAVLRR